MTPPAARCELPGPLLVITDRRQARAPLERIADAVGRAGGRWLLLRERDLERGERAALAARLVAVAARHGMALSVSADVDLAADLDMAGLHLQSAAAVGTARARLGSRVVIGVSAHNLAELAEAAAARADYATLSPIFLSASKPAYGPPLGLASLASAAKVGIPILALGGISEDNAGLCAAAGAAGIAVMGGIMRAENPADVVAGLITRISHRTWSRVRNP
jgi:thiamine-phosphate pyrophosphorylase